MTLAKTRKGEKDVFSEGILLHFVFCFIPDPLGLCCTGSGKKKLLTCSASKATSTLLCTLLSCGLFRSVHNSRMVLSDWESLGENSMNNCLASDLQMKPKCRKNRKSASLLHDVT
ncbi:hypothetical protein FKM82_017030 [Ascaphus truei]